MRPGVDMYATEFIEERQADYEKWGHLLDKKKVDHDIAKMAKIFSEAEVFVMAADGGYLTDMS